MRRYEEDEKKVAYPIDSPVEGPWSKIDPGFELKAKLKRNKTLSLVMPDEEKDKYIAAGRKVPDYYDILGIYSNRDICFEDGSQFQLAINIVVDDLRGVIKTHGIEKVLAACEKSLNAYVSDKGEKLLGDIAIVELICDNSDREDPLARFLSCRARTNKENIRKFMGLDRGKLRVF